MNANNQIAAPMKHYTALYKKLDPQAAAARCGIEFKSDEFIFNLLGRTVKVAFPDFYAYDAVNPDKKLSDGVMILLIRYIIEGAGGRGSGKFISYAEVPWGQVYLGNFKGRCIARLAFGFGSDLLRFSRACEALGGIPVPAPNRTGDASYDIEFLSEFIIRVIIWGPDEEMPPNAQILFSDNFPLAFKAEDIAVVGDVLIDAMKKVN